MHRRFEFIEAIVRLLGAAYGLEKKDRPAGDDGAAAAEREVKRRAAHEVSVERTRLVGKLDVGVLSVIAGFGGKREPAEANPRPSCERRGCAPWIDRLIVSGVDSTALRFDVPSTIEAS